MGRRLSDLRRAARQWDIEIANTKRGRHPFKAFGMKDGRNGMYPFGTHNGFRTEIRPDVLRAFCDYFGLDIEEVKEAMKW